MLYLSGPLGISFVAGSVSAAHRCQGKPSGYPNTSYQKIAKLWKEMICHISSQNNWVQTSLGFCFSICVSILAKTTFFSLHPPYRPQPLILVVASVSYLFSLSGSYKVIYWDVLGTVQNRATGKNEQRTDDRIWIALVGWGRGVGASSGSKQLLLTVTKYLHSSISGNASPAVCSGFKWGGRQDRSKKYSF